MGYSKDWNASLKRENEGVGSGYFGRSLGRDGVLVYWGLLLKDGGGFGLGCLDVYMYVCGRLGVRCVELFDILSMKAGTGCRGDEVA